MNINVSHHCVFQMAHPRTKVTFQCIEECKAASVTLRTQDKIDYFEANGINYTNVMRYHDFVQELDRVFRIDAPWYVKV